MPLAEDQHPVGGLSPGGEHEPFCISVRARASPPGACPLRPAPTAGPLHLCHQNLPERHRLPSLQVRNEPEDHSRVVHQLVNQVVPSSWQQPSAGGPMLMADDNFLGRNQASAGHLLEMPSGSSET